MICTFCIAAGLLGATTRPQAFIPHFKLPPQRYLTGDFQRLQIICIILLENVRRIYIYSLTTVDFIPAKRISSYKKLKNLKLIMIMELKRLLDTGKHEKTVHI